ncbi:hypothetical protein [Polynucleobacter sp. MWH-UH23A]|uniref:hypothetical protein n=1 Tax=Polynucleobacter sp. MWH-UH23A TaxID=1855613 RepID=UPI003364DB20
MPDLLIFMGSEAENAAVTNKKLVIREMTIDFIIKQYHNLNSSQTAISQRGSFMNMKINQIFAGLFLSSAAAFANANCYGTANSYNCYDSQSGNSYNVQKYGNTTQMQGYNANTGNSWSQNSNTYGNQTYTQGTASNGNSWNQTTTPNAVYGTDSRGNYYYRNR